MLPGGWATLHAAVIVDPHTKHSATINVAARHPALAGHFPGNPIVPGVIILDAVISAAEEWLGPQLHLRALSLVKFLAPLKPDESARIDLALRGSTLEFVVHRGETTVAKGALRIAQGAEA
jgi:3-hydroxymyristoyl/3-hydroxydecanoyl-(acyl carrier protein) dehydratase